MKGAPTKRDLEVDSLASLGVPGHLGVDVDLELHSERLRLLLERAVRVQCGLLLHALVLLCSRALARRWVQHVWRHMVDSTSEKQLESPSQPDVYHQSPKECRSLGTQPVSR